MPKTYILYYEFEVTRDNHGGMAYLARSLKEEFNDVELLKHIHQAFRGGKFLGWLYSLFLALFLILKLRKDDKVVFLEYLTGNFAYQHLIGRIINKFHKTVKRFGLVHLDGTYLLKLLGSNEEILKRLDHVDEVLVFGSSLKAFIQSLGFDKPVTTTFHYVDTEYYRPGNETFKPELQVVFIGNLKRDYSKLAHLIKHSAKDIKFHICLGRTPKDDTFKNLPNVSEYGYLKEDELLSLMQRSDISLSVLEDTIGSNAITASLAVGLVQVVSDVGSIRDYCNEKNAFFCKNIDDFVNAINWLNNHPDALIKMKKAARQRSLELSLKNFKKEFQQIIGING